MSNNQYLLDQIPLAMHNGGYISIMLRAFIHYHIKNSL